MITKAFAKGPAFIGYLTLGDGGLDYTLSSALALVKGGVDILEIGIPFSDPVADGPVIQKAMERSLKCGTKPHDVIPFLKAFREQSDIPVIIFSYYNPLLASPGLMDLAKEAGANGILVVDLPFELMPKTALDPVLIVSTSTPQERVKEIAKKGRGFIYYACQKGTTGMRGSLPSHCANDIARIKKESNLPVAIGFGISERSSAKEALQLADGFIVGSYFVDAMSRKVSSEELIELAKQIDPRSPS